jgi:hypothetical protein
MMPTLAIVYCLRASGSLITARVHRARFLHILMAVVAMAIVTSRPGGVALARVSDEVLPRRELLDQALAVYRRVESAGLVRTKLLTVIDYSLPSWERRLWVLDPSQPRVLFHEFVAHGRGSTTDDDPDRAIRFGNEAASLRSSLGGFLTGKTYTGAHGTSLELVGLDPGVNDKAMERRIVMHPATYVSAAFRAVRGGRVGRSWGCPALDPAVAAAIIGSIRNGSLIYIGGAAPARVAVNR